MQSHPARTPERAMSGRIDRTQAAKVLESRPGIEAGSRE